MLDHLDLTIDDEELARAVGMWQEHAKAIVKETGVSQKDARATVNSLPFKIIEFLPEDVAAEQALSDAFFDAGEIKNKVDLTTISENILPGGFDSSALS